MSIDPKGIYITRFENVSVSAAQDLFEIVAPSACVVSIDEIYLGNGSLHTGVIDNMRMNLKRISGAPTSGSGGSAGSIQAVQGDSTAAGSTIEINNTTQLTGGTTELAIPFIMHIQTAEMRKSFSGKDKIVLSPGEYFVWSLDDPPSSASNLSAYVKFSEYGG